MEKKPSRRQLEQAESRANQRLIAEHQKLADLTAGGIWWELDRQRQYVLSAERAYQAAATALWG